MQRTVWNILIAASIIGVLSIVAVGFLTPPIDIQVYSANADSTFVDSVFNACTEYRIRPAHNLERVDHSVKWRIDTIWIPEDQMIEAYDFESVGMHTIELYVDGKKRGERTIELESCAKADIYIPEGLLRGQHGKMIDRTPGSVSRQWFVNGESHADEDGSLNFQFLYAREYDIRVLIEMKDEVYEYTRTIEVKAASDRSPERRSPSNVVPYRPNESRVEVVKPQREVVTEQPVVRQKEEVRPPRTVAPVAKPVETVVQSSPTPEPKVVRPTPTVSSSSKSELFGQFSESDPSFSNDGDVWSDGNEDCLTYNGDRTTITLRNLSKDVCITNLYFAPKRDVRGNKVEVVISNTSDTEKKKVLSRVRTVGVTRPGQPLSKVYVASDSQIGEVDKSNANCYNDSFDVEFGDVIVRGRTKIMKMDVRVR